MADQRNLSALKLCNHSCLAYLIESDNPTLNGQYDIAAYDPSCPVHGWRWDVFEPRRGISLAEAERIDREKAEALNV